jgi:outer membrane protein assembly factor BamA
MQDGFIISLVLKKEKLLFKIKDSVGVERKLKEFSIFWINKNYLAFSYDSIVWDTSNVKSYLSLGPCISFDSIQLTGIPYNILKQAGLKQNARHINKMSYSDLLKIRENLVRTYENAGYPFASVCFKDIEFENQFIKAKLIIEKNGFFTIDSIIIKGGPKISRKYLLHRIQIKSGQTYKQTQIENVGKILNDLSFIKQIKPPELEFRENKADLYLYLRSNPSNFFSGMIGIQSDSVSDASVKFTGDISLILQNSFKIGDRIDFYWNKFSANSQNLRLGFNLPYLFILPFGISTKLGIEKNQAGYLNTNVYFSLNYTYSGNNDIKAFYQVKKSFIIENDSNSSIGLSGYSSRTAGLGFLLDNTDYRLNPTKGYYIEASTAYGSTANEGQKSQSLVELGFDGAVYFKLSKIFSLSFLNHSSGLLGPPGFYQNQLFKIGGINLLRGFDEKSIFASSHSVFSFEPKLSFGRNSAFFLFTDIAWYESKQIGNYHSDTPMGFGAGMNIDTKAGIFKLIYALGKQEGNHIKLSNSKVHFGFSAIF